jgi:predicted ATPase/class 3 adenylate cyclase
MKCPKCQTENPQANKFCRSCGTKLILECAKCGAEVILDDGFCGKCGHKFNETAELYKTSQEVEGERKHVTVLFSDLTGYTAISEKLDPEEVKEITSRIFGEISKIVDKYDGFIEKYAGDAVMVIFGVPKTHEDDPIRAVKVAREIHELIDSISPELESTIGKPISMHTGINTGLVVTGEVDMERGTHGVVGDTINLASRLSNLAKPGEILVDVDTCRQVEGQFTCEYIGPTMVKGRTEPVKAHRVISKKERPVTIRRLTGLRADFVGRKVELAELSKAVENLRNGKGRIFSICGDAGTGKSRLVEEFKATLDLDGIQWLEGHAYPYAQNIPYFPFIDLLNRVFRIEEGDPPERIRERIEIGIKDLIGKKEDVVPYIGSLYALSYPEVDDVSPEFWKSRLIDAALTIITVIAKKAPTIYLLEDLHWADPSFVELFRNTILQIRQPAIILCVHRPAFTLFTSQQIDTVANIHHEIRLQDLSPSEAQDVLESLLKTETIPSDLRQFVQDKAEGNPFYLEEMVNSLIESEILKQDNGGWRITRPISESDISSTIHGVISDRLDRLERETKRILQEASVIGRTFLYVILKRITELKHGIDQYLRGLEQLDLIRTRTPQPELEYIFKHALTQEVVYNGLLKKERREIHERIGQVMEQLFKNRLSKFYETLSYHFKQGQSVLKAVHYLIMSGEKSLKHYSVEEAHQYYKEAFDLIANKTSKSKEEQKILIEILNKWSLVFYYRGDFKELTELFTEHEDVAVSLDDKGKLGMFYVWLGFAHIFRENFKESYKYLRKALELGEKLQNQELIGHACSWLTFNCWDLGLLNEGITYGEKAYKISKILKTNHFLYYKPLLGMSQLFWLMGESKKNFEIGRNLLEYGNRHSNIRCLVTGHISNGYGHLTVGDFTSAIECFQKAIEVAKDPFYSQMPRYLLASSYLQNGQFHKAGDLLQEVASYSKNFGCEYFGTPVEALLGATLIAEGEISRGFKMLERAHRAFTENDRKPAIAMLEHIFGRIYLQIVEGGGSIDFPAIIKNIGSLIKNIPWASKKAEQHFNKAIEVASDIGANGLLGQIYLDLGLLHKAKNRIEQAHNCFSKAVQIFEGCKAEVYLKQANEALESLR